MECSDMALALVTATPYRKHYEKDRNGARSKQLMRSLHFNGPARNNAGCQAFWGPSDRSGIITKAPTFRPQLSPTLGPFLLCAPGAPDRRGREASHGRPARRTRAWIADLFGRAQRACIGRDVVADVDLPTLRTQVGHCGSPKVHFRTRVPQQTVPLSNCRMLEPSTFGLASSGRMLPI